MLKPRRGGVYLDGALITLAAVEGGRARAGPAAAELDRAGRDHRRRPRRPRPLPAPAAAAPVVARRRAGGRRRRWRPRSVADLADRIVDELSGGQRQRVWLAMALAQETPILLLDEPTTFLDIAHQVEVLDLCAELHEEQGRTLVAVLHDLNHACRYATHLIAMRDGAIVAQGEPAEIVDRRAGRGGVRPALPGDRRPGDRAPRSCCPSAGVGACVACPDDPAPVPAAHRHRRGRARRDAHAEHVAHHAHRSRAGRLRRRGARRDRHARLAGARPRAGAAASAAGASRRAPRTSTGATTRCARYDPARARDRRRLLPARRRRARRRRGRSRAEPGDRIGFAGPRTHWRERNGGADWSLLVADETGLPALLAILETLPAGHRATALVEVGDDARAPAGRERRRRRAALALARRRALPARRPCSPTRCATSTLPRGRGRAWGGGEARAMRAVRDHLRDQRGWRARRCRRSATGSTTVTPEEMW